MVKVKISIEDDGKSITVQDTIREVLASTAFAAWRAVMSAD